MIKQTSFEGHNPKRVREGGEEFMVFIQILDNIRRSGNNKYTLCKECW